MSGRIREYIRHNVLGFVAIFIALNAGAYAVTVAPPNSVVSSSIKDGEVRRPDLGSGAVTSPKLVTGAVTKGKIANGAVTNPKLGANAVGSTKVASNSLTGSDINESSLGIVPNANQLDGMDSTAFLGATAAAGGDLSGNFPSPSIGANAVGSSEVINNSLTGADISESTLGIVPQAANASTADGVDFSRFAYFSVNATATKTEVVNLGGLILRASCPGGLLAVEADTTGSNVQLNSSSSDAVTNVVTNGVSNDDFDPGDNVNILPNSPGGATDQVGHTELGFGTSVVWQAETAAAGGAACMFSGHAMF